MPIDLTPTTLSLAEALSGPGGDHEHSRLTALRSLLDLLQTPAALTAFRKAAPSRREADVLLVAARALVDQAEVALQAWRRAQPANPIPVAVVLEGGLVQAICCAERLPALRFEVVDYDVEGAAPDETLPVHFVDGPTSTACRRTVSLSAPSDIDWARFDDDAA